MFVVNHLKLTKKIKESSMKKIAEGGFSKIYLAEVEHQPINSYQLTKDEPLEKGIEPRVKQRQFVLKR